MISRDDLNRYLDNFLEVQKYTDYAPNGLQVEGCTSIQKIVSGVTACQALLEKAIAANADAVLVHHGYFWKGESQTVTGIKRHRLGLLLGANLNLFAYHLPLDGHDSLGNNVMLAKKLGFQVERRFGVGGGADIGFLGRLQQPMTGEALKAHCEQVLAPNRVLHIPGTATPIENIAWCTGGAQAYITQATEQRAQAYLTGEVSEQTVHFARETGCHFFACGHHATERYGIQALGEHLAEKFGLAHEFIDIDNPA